MRRPKRFCYILVALVIVGVTSTSAISTSSKTKSISKPREIKPVANKDEELPSPSPTSSPATEDTEFSSRRGGKKEKDDGFMPSVAFKIADQTKNSSIVAASSKSSHIAYPESAQDTKSSSLDGEKEDGPQSVVLELLDEKEASGEVQQSSDSLKDGSHEGEERSKYPRIYYGEASPPRHHGHYGSKKENSQHELSKEQQYPEHLGGHPPKYFYPKSYVHNKHKAKKSKKKRFEYQYDQDSRQAVEPQFQQNHEFDYASPTPQQSPQEGQFYGSEGETDIFNGFEQDSPGTSDYGRNNNGYKYDNSYEQRPGAVEVISKALHLLIPSAILLTGLSAVFPNRIHVPTNDFRPQDHHHIRHRRSIRRYSDLSNEMLEPEHRSFDDPPILPTSSYKSYNFEIGSPRSKSLDFVPLTAQEYEEIQTLTDNAYRDSKNEEYTEKGSVKTNKLRAMKRVPQSPEEYDRFHYGPQIAYNNVSPTTDSSFAPSSIATPTLATLEKSNIETSNKRKTRTRSRVRVRPANRRSRPLPFPTQVAMKEINEFQAKLVGVNKLPAFKRININQTPKTHEDASDSETQQTFRLGNEYLKSLVEGHEEDESKKEKAKNMDFSPDSPVMGLITSYAEHDKESPACQKRALCELALKGKSPTATKFEKFLWSLASLVPEQFSKMYELDEIFNAVKSGSCDVFQCFNTNVDLQM